VVSYRGRRRLTECLASLAAQTDRDFETILVDNGGNEALRVADLPLRRLRMARNTGACGGRNAGLAEAVGEIVFFLDDDAVADPGMVAACKRAFRERPEVVALRGRALLRSRTACNYLQNICDLGEEPLPSLINQEAVCGFRRRALVAAGGWGTIFMGEGVDLSVRLARAHGRESLIYQPDVIAHHDFSHNLRDFLRLSARWGRNREVLRSRHPDLDEVMGYYRRWLPKGDAGRRAKGGRLFRLKLSVLRRLQRALWNRPWLQRVVLGPSQARAARGS
jgi:glycosyltransferase involved in cell wall biosynthesis